MINKQNYNNYVLPYSEKYCIFAKEILYESYCMRNYARELLHDKAREIMHEK